jgi:heme-degrading monooxygenase HmoA
MNGFYASGNWIVKHGSQEDFVARWTEFLEWTRERAPGLASAQLIQDSEDPSHFISFAGWESAEAMARWRELPEFATWLAACRALCEDFRGSSYRLAAAAAGNVNSGQAN